jgi:hypothetical protein
MRAVVRYHLHYSPKILNEMSMQDLAEAYNDVIFVRALETKKK